MSDAIRFGIVGLGNIGSGVVEVFSENRELINSRLPRPLRLVRVAERDPAKKRALPEGAELSDRAESVLSADDIDIVVELVGGVDPTRRFVETALRAGKHVVTANKALIADCGPELFALAAKSRVSLLFEAAVGGGIPIIRALQQGMAPNEITSVRGIINGTCNYILTRMAKEGLRFQDVLADAQRLGYAEADPTADIEGHDAAQKIAILASLAFGMDVRFSDVFVEGISQVHPDDLSLAEDQGCVIRLVATARRQHPGDPAEVRVHPVMLPRESALGQIDGVTNAVEVTGNAVTKVVLSGPGAGPRPTAAAVLSDVMNVAQQMVDGGASLDRRLQIPAGECHVKPMAEVSLPHCLRLSLIDHPEVEQRVRDLLGAQGVAVERFIDRGRRVGEYFNAAVFTAAAPVASLQTALNELASKEISLEPPSVIRLEDES